MDATMQVPHRVLCYAVWNFASLPNITSHVFKNFSNKSLFDYIQEFDNAQGLYSQSIVNTVYGWFKKECHGKKSKNDYFLNQSL